MRVIDNIVDELRKDEGIVAIVLGGSVSAHLDDGLSDYDIYVYSNMSVDVNFRENVAKKFADKFEVNNHFFEDGDEWILRDSQKVVDIMYRNCNDIQASVDWTWHQFGACVGYSTCFIFNIKNSVILFDKNDWFKNLQNSVSGEYPQQLAENIIAKNLPLLKFKLTASYILQVEKAIKRGDKISVNHRITAFVASYFDVLFAKNKILHCGEKRLLPYAIKNCKILPTDFESDMNNLFECPNKVEILNKLADNLKDIL